MDPNQSAFAFAFAFAFEKIGKSMYQCDDSGCAEEQIGANACIPWTAMAPEQTQACGQAQLTSRRDQAYRRASMASGQGAGAQPGMHVIMAGRSGQMVNRHRRLRGKLRTAISVFAASREQPSMSSRRAESRHRRLRGKRGTAISAFAASGEQVAEPTLITANRAGQIGNDVIKMCTGGQRKTFVPV